MRSHRIWPFRSPKLLATCSRAQDWPSNRGRDKAALVLIDPTKPDAEELIYAHPQVDLDSAAWSRVRRTPAIVAELEYAQVV